MSNPYEEDFVLWTERQATLLLRRAAGDQAIDGKRQEIEDLLADNPSLRA